MSTVVFLAIMHWITYIIAARYGLRGWPQVHRLGRLLPRLWWGFGLTIPVSLAAGFISGVHELMIPAAVAAVGLVSVAWPIQRVYRRFTAPEELS